MESAVQIFDIKRLLMGDAPPLYMLEILQLSTIEFVLVIALGSAVGDAMFYPEVPLLHALLVITLVVLANKGLDVLISRSKRAE